MQEDSSATLVQSVRRFFSGTIVSRVCGFAREVLMASIFGLTPTVAAFWMAYRFAYLPRRLFGEGGLHVAFIPHFERLRSQNPAAAALFFLRIGILMAMVLLGVVVISEVGLGCALAFTHSSDRIEVMHLTMILLPAIVFISLLALNAALLNCEKIFFLPSLTPAFFNTAWIALLLFFHYLHLPEKAALYSLSVGLVIAFCIPWAVTWLPVRRFLYTHLGQNWIKQIFPFQFRDLFAFLGPFSLALVGVAATQINALCDSLFARAALSEGPAILWYAQRLVQVPMALFGVGWMGAALPPLSRAHSGQREEKYHELFAFSFHKLLYYLIPVTFFLFIGGYSSVSFTYGHGNFDTSNIFSVTKVLWAYGSGLVPQAAVLLLAAACYSKGNFFIPMVASVVSMVGNVLFNTLFVRVFHLGTISIAYTTSLLAWGNALFLLWYLLSKKEITLPSMKGDLSRILMASTIATAITGAVGTLFLKDPTLSLLLGNAPVDMPRSVIMQSIHFFLLIVTYALAYKTVSRKSVASDTLSTH